MPGAAARSERRVARRIAIAAGVIVAVVVLVVIAAAVGARALRDQPNLIALWRFEQLNGNADVSGEPVALLWTVETYNDTVSFEGPAGAAAPSGLRIVLPDGMRTTAVPMRTLDPAVNVSVCPERRPAKGTTWWSGLAPPDMARDLRQRGSTSHQVEVLVRGEWRRTVLFDSGCRGLGHA